MENTTNTSNNVEMVGDVTFRYLLSINVLCALIAVLGCVGNVFNLFNFYTQGLHSTANICLFNIAIGDLLTCVFSCQTAVSAFPWFTRPEGLSKPALLSWDIGSWYTSTLVWNSSWTSLVLAFERCLFVFRPMKAQALIRRRVLEVYFVILFVISLVTPTSFIYWTSGPVFVSSGKTKIIRNVLVSTTPLLLTSSCIFAAFELFPLICLPGLNVFMIRRLRQHSRWRANFGGMSGSSTVAISRRDKRVLSMAVAVSTIYLACNVPKVGSYFFAYLMPEIRSGRAYIFTISLINFFTTVNASVNIFVYYRLSRNFMDTFHGLLAQWLAIGQSCCETNSD